MNEQDKQCRLWVTHFVADDAQYARMVEYSTAHNTLSTLEAVVCASSRPLLVASAAGLLEA
jgi:hypothetical protein